MDVYAVATRAGTSKNTWPRFTSGVLLGSRTPAQIQVAAGFSIEERTVFDTPEIIVPLDLFQPRPDTTA